MPKPNPRAAGNAGANGPASSNNKNRGTMKAHLRLLGRKVKLSDGTIGRVINTASHENRLMVEVRLDGGDAVRWEYSSDTTAADD